MLIQRCELFNTSNFFFNTLIPKTFPLLELCYTFIHALQQVLSPGIIALQESQRIGLDNPDPGAALFLRVQSVCSMRLLQ